MTIVFNTIDELVGVSKDTILSHYKTTPSILTRDGNIVILEKLGDEIGISSLSDIILIFSEEDTCLLAAERIHKSDYTKFSWYFIKKRVYRFFKQYNKTSRDMQITVTEGKGFTDVVACRKEWYECINEVFLSP